MIQRFSSQVSTCKFYISTNLSISFELQTFGSRYFMGNPWMTALPPPLCQSIHGCQSYCAIHGQSTLEINEFLSGCQVCDCATEAFSTTCAVHVEDCEGWWLSDCCGSVAEHWQLKPEVSWV